MNKTIYLHIGMGKTGTTTLQYGLKDNYDLLLSYGWLYPKAGRYHQEGSVHHNVAFDIKNDPRYFPTAGGLKALVKEIYNSTEENIIISSEVFSQETINPLYDALSPLGDIKIIVYFRRQINSLVSLWSQQVKTCETAEPFESWVRSRFSNGNYYGYIDQWAKVYGKENIFVRPLEAGQMHGHILEDFLITCGFEHINELTLPKNKNISPGIKTLETIRYFTLQFGTAVPPLGEHFSYQISRMILNFGNKNGWNKQRPKLVSEELALEIENEYKKSNSQLAKAYLKQNKLFLEERPVSDEQPFSIDDHNPSELLELTTYLLKRIEMNPTRIPEIQRMISEGRIGRFRTLLNQIRYWLGIKQPE